MALTILKHSLFFIYYAALGIKSYFIFLFFTCVFGKSRFKYYFTRFNEKFFTINQYY